MGMAPVAYGLWQKRLNFDPADPIWPNRDRFILSAAHASMLLYALLAFDEDNRQWMPITSSWAVPSLYT